jgi:hypothetical protein
MLRGILSGVDEQPLTCPNTIPHSNGGAVCSPLIAGVQAQSNKTITNPNQTQTKQKQTKHSILAS